MTRLAVALAVALAAAPAAAQTTGFDGAYIRFAGNFQVLSVAWQYSWISGASMSRTATTPSDSSSRQE